MSSDIKAGDLVMVVRPKPCCGLESYMGLVGIAQVSDPNIGSVRCFDCGFIGDDFGSYFFLEKGHAHVSRLKKIDPPALDESLKLARELEIA